MIPPVVTPPQLILRIVEDVEIVETAVHAFH
jgi:hypothetical protein